MEDIRQDSKTILEVIWLIKNECPNNDEGGLCDKPSSNCLECWQSYQSKISKLPIKLYEESLKCSKNR